MVEMSGWSGRCRTMAGWFRGFSLVFAPATIASVVAWTGGPWWVIVPLSTAAAAALVDARSRRVPNRLVAATAGSSLAGSLVAGAEFVPLVMVMMAFAGPLLLVRLATPAAIGSGDVKLAAVSAPVLFVGGAAAGLLALCVASGSAGAIGVLRRRSSIPFGPAVVIGTVVAGTTHAWGSR